MFCPHCGMENPDDSKFCAGCGKDVTAVEVVEEAVVVEEAPVQEVNEPDVVVMEEPVVEAPAEAEVLPEEPVVEPVAEVAAEPAVEVVPEPVAEVIPEPVVEPVQPQYVPPQPQYVPPQPQYVPPQSKYQQPYQPQYQQSYQPQYQQPYQPQYQQHVSYAKPAPVGDSRVTAAVKRACGSPLMLIIAICYTLSLLTSFLSAFGGGSALYGLAELMRELGASRSDVSVLYDIADGGLVFSVLGLVPDILMCIGLFMVFASAASKKNTMSTGGLTMLKVVYILQMIFVCIVMGIFVIVMGIAVLSALSYGHEDAIIGTIVMFMLVAGITAFAVCYYAAILRSISKVQTALRTGYADHRVSGFVAVLCFIAGAGSLISLILSFVSVGGYLRGGAFLLLSVLPSLVSIALNFMIGIQMFRYRGIVREVSNV